MQITRLLHQGPAPLWRRSTASYAPPGYQNHWHRHAGHERIHHMAMPEDMGRDLPPGELLPARNLLDPGFFCQAVYGPQHGLGTQVARAPAGEEPLLDGLFKWPDYRVMTLDS
jgi:hypothetical protein